ncbi:MAG: RagB/SusD family nutrient uptake outer membrane protein [Dysgonamonadaceae bacterium]|jgi:hypothetical protein|nr:RagB/SusD family nutrient uptake outer membrane protein [Dysgonamonadaceae bacterium]
MKDTNNLSDLKAIMSIKSLKFLMALAFLFATFSCSDYLNIVPDNAPDFNSLFTSKELAYNALAKMYAYMPTDNRDIDPVLAGDEWVHEEINDTHNAWLQGIRWMRGLQSASSPVIGWWSGDNAPRLYIPIREADLILPHIDDIPDLSAKEKADWKAQVKYMKAYYLFLLVNTYGPIVIYEKTVLPDAQPEEMLQPRRKVEYCFDYIIRLMDEAIPDLELRRASNDLGQIDQVGAKAIKAKIMLYRASPFFNGSSDYYKNFVDHDGQPFFTMEAKPEKWKEALDAVNTALEACKQANIELYRFEGYKYGYDSTAVRLNPDNMQTLYDLRMLLVDPWNKELIWGASNVKNQARVFVAANIIKPDKDEYAGPGPAMNADMCYNQLGASLNSVERFYTNHGLPIDEDKTYDIVGQYDIVTTPAQNDPAYLPLYGIMQPAVQTVRMYLNREPRFYADLGITGGYWRTHFVCIKTMMMNGTDGGRQISFPGYYLRTGIGVQKVGHPESFAGPLTAQVMFPYPIIRLADLYLMKAEALNEYSGPSQEIYDAINEVRRRAGIPNVEESYTNPDWVKPGALNKHMLKDGLREIILRERAVEFAYENATYFWDMRRHNRAVACFNKRMRGWSPLSNNAANFFKLAEIDENRVFTERDQLFPISIKEMEINTNLIQNPGY